MSIQRQDYILRQIELLRQFVARLASRRTDPELEEALLLSFHLQEKLFPLPPAEFLRLDLAAQLEALRRHETPTAAREKCLAYATLLAETAILYDFKSRDDLAAGARQMALYAALSSSMEKRVEPATVELVERLSALIPSDRLHAPVAELLEEFRRHT